MSKEQYIVTVEKKDESKTGCGWYIAAIIMFIVGISTLIDKCSGDKDKTEQKAIPQKQLENNSKTATKTTEPPPIRTIDEDTCVFATHDTTTHVLVNEGATTHNTEEVTSIQNDTNKQNIKKSSKKKKRRKRE